MKVLIFGILYLVREFLTVSAFITLSTLISFIKVARIKGNSLIDDDGLSAEIAKAKQRLEKDFILNLWYGVNEAIAESQDKVLKIYTQYTIEQAHNVVEHISMHKNLVRFIC